MSALFALVLAASELTPPPAVEAPPAPPAPPVAEAAGADDLVGVAEDDLTAQLVFITLESVNGLWVGLNTCALFGCFSVPGSAPVVGGALGVGAGFALSFFNRDLAGDWGRAALLTSGSAGAAIGTFWLANQPIWPSSEARYLVAGGFDAVLTVGLVVLARYVSPRPEEVWLADSLALWGALVGNLATSFLGVGPNNTADLMIVGAAAGALAGGLLGSTARMSATRFWAANGAAMLGGLVIGGGLLIVERARSNGAHLFDPAVPAAGAAAGIFGGFLVGFALSEGF